MFLFYELVHFFLLLRVKRTNIEPIPPSTRVKEGCWTLSEERGVLGFIMLVDVLRHLGCAIMRYTGERAILAQGSFSWRIPKLIRLLPVERETDYVGSLRQEQFGEIQLNDPCVSGSLSSVSCS